MGPGSSATSPLWIKPISRLALPWGPQRGALGLSLQGAINAGTFPRHHYLVPSALPSLWYPSQVGGPFSPPKLSTYDGCQSSCIFIECFLCARVLKKAPYLLILWLGWILELSFFLFSHLCGEGMDSRARCTQGSGRASERVHVRGAPECPRVSPECPTRANRGCSALSVPMSPYAVDTMTSPMV